ncbi:MAG: NAD(P)/FAD-dependent oxidoreductase, partial [Acidobacteriales bacterium]|nr:NAD(P)/FAD-dependent oxidoreductase [Terriglobales bacterium]
MNNPFDLIVIGVGMAGQNIARRVRAAGWEVAVVDSRPYGGTCPLRGCDPKKVLVGAAEIMDWHRRMTGHGIAGDMRISWADLMRFKRTFTDPIPANIEKSLSSSGIATYHGEAHFVDPNSLQVDGEMLTAKRIAIATGAKPRDLGIPGAEYAATSTDFLELESLPQRIVFIGGGYISFEFAHIAARAGARVTIVQRDARPLEAFDADLVEVLVAATESIGIDVRLQVEVTAVKKEGSQLRVHTSDGGGLPADLVVHGAGRVPEIDGLLLKQGGIEYT